MSVFTRSCKAFALISLLSFFFISCNKIKNIWPETKPIKTTTIVCLVDFSKSIPASTLEWYRETVNNNVLKNMGLKDKIVILPIDYGSETSSTELFFADMSKKDFKREMDSPVQGDKPERRRFEICKDSTIKSFDSVFSKAKIERGKYALGTDIIGGLKQADKYFAGDQNNLLVIFSDMIQETEEINLTKQLRSESDLKIIFKRVSIPILKNAEVVVMTGDQPAVKINQYNLLRKFWEEYLSKAHLTLTEYQSGGTNILAEKILSYQKKPK